MQAACRLAHLPRPTFVQLDYSVLNYINYSAPKKVQDEKQYWTECTEYV